MRGDDATDASSDGSCSSQDYAPAPNSHEERWVPYRHTNGVAIYHQRQSKCSGLWGDEEGGDAAAGLGVGSEYMASSIVRGSPDECLAVLMDLASNTTILGPASAIELLEDADERQVRPSTGWHDGAAPRMYDIYASMHAVGGLQGSPG